MSSPPNYDQTMKSCVLKVYTEERKTLIRKCTLNSLRVTELDHIYKIPSPPTVTTFWQTFLGA